MANYHQLCNRYRGRVVRITDRGGRVHVGRIANVSRSHVYIQPLTRGRGPRGFGYFGYRYGYGYGYGPAYGVALGFITGVALSALFFI
ncbi:hypothetical protein [Metabacillus iocasae]|uniref:Uncharacterized protein n=1 Tax=Priestia iocasae TaxID=2291674 RepID=A0ABS2QRD5_9BACI|nr:hypothetical protein [Metabacillus iocasae]MBM7702013.1 hypothetical protein [Metabacillus iocasae]